jgi:hypothetical protein
MDFPATSSHIEQHDSVHDEFVAALLLCQALKTRHRPTLVARPLKGMQTPGIVHMRNFSTRSCGCFKHSCITRRRWHLDSNSQKTECDCDVQCRLSVAASIVNHAVIRSNVKSPSRHIKTRPEKHTNSTFQPLR